jgi:cardiolipin synthase
VSKITLFTLNSRRYKKFIETHTASPIRVGNQIDILTNGDEIFPSMLDAINAATETIAFLTYVYWRGDIATLFAQTLARKAREGVNVSVLLDAFGSSKIDAALIAHMQDASVQVLWFRPLRWYTLHKINNRTHRKILVVDGVVGFIGGVGIAEEWTGDAQSPRHWRDTHFKITGPAVQDLVMSFNDNWQEAGGTPHTPGIATPTPSRGITLQITSSKGGAARTDGEALFYSAIRAAQTHIRITTAYFAPSHTFREALLRARQAGVDVTILTNGSHTNHALVRKAGHRHYAQLLKAGIRIYEYEQTLLHAKVMTIDSSWAIVGSINFDDRSFVLNDEINMSLTDPVHIRALDDQLSIDLQHSKEIVLHRWLVRPLIAKISETIGDLLRKQL